MSLLDDLKGLEKFIHLGALQCGVCREEYGNCEANCFSRFLPWLAKKLSEDGYLKKADLEAEGWVKVPVTAHCSRCGELPRLYQIEATSEISKALGEGGSWACNCGHCGYGSLAGLPSIPAAIDRWNEWNDQKEWDWWGDERRKQRHEEAEEERC